MHKCPSLHRGVQGSAGRFVWAFVRRKPSCPPQSMRSRRSGAISRCSSVDDRYFTAKAVFMRVFFKIGAILHKVCKLNCANFPHNVKIVCESRTKGKENARGRSHAQMLLYGMFENQEFPVLPVKGIITCSSNQPFSAFM